MHRLITSIGTFTARPLAFVIVILYGVAWSIFGQMDWHSIATFATLLLALFIQRAEHRDTQAIQAKLDELLRAEHRASNDLTTIDEREPEEIEQVRKER